MKLYLRKLCNKNTKRKIQQTIFKGSTDMQNYTDFWQWKSKEYIKLQ